MIVVEDYKISHTTKALTHFLHPELCTKIYDQDGIFYSTKTMRQLLEEACRRYCTSYKGRLSAVRETFRYAKKTPLIISPEELLCTFPTTSPDDLECQWIFIAHISKYVIKNNQVYVEFKNGGELKLFCSSHTYLTQNMRASQCLVYFAHPRLIQKRRD